MLGALDLNSGGAQTEERTATQAFPSLSAALMMLCRTTAVPPTPPVAGVRAGASALAGPDRGHAKKKTEGEEMERTVSHRNNSPYKTQPPRAARTANTILD